MTTSEEILKALQVPADPSKLTDQQLSRAMSAARKIQMSSVQDSPEWKAAAALINALTVENHRRLFPNEPPPSSGSHVPGKKK